MKVQKQADLSFDKNNGATIMVIALHCIHTSLTCLHTMVNSKYTANCKIEILSNISSYTVMMMLILMRVIVVMITIMMMMVMTMMTTYFY